MENDILAPDPVVAARDEFCPNSFSVRDDFLNSIISIDERISGLIDFVSSNSVFTDPADDVILGLFLCTCRSNICTVRSLLDGSYRDQE